MMASHPPPPTSPLDRIVIESTDVDANVSFWRSNFNATCAVANATSTTSSGDGSDDMDTEHQTDGGKKHPLPGGIVGIQPGCIAAVRISPTTVLDIVDVSGSANDDDDHSKNDSSNEQKQQQVQQQRQRRTKRRKSPFDSIILYLSGSDIIDTIDRFKRNGILVSKVSEGTCGAGQIEELQMSCDGARGSDSNGKYVSVHFFSPDGKLGELRTDDAGQLDAIREAALPLIQAYLRGVIHSSTGR